MTEGWLKDNIWPLFSRVMARDEIYLANHSLGRPPDEMQLNVARALTIWYEKMDAAWTDWMQEVDWFQKSIARLINAKRVAPKTSAGQGLRAVLNTYDGKINVVATTGEFDSIDFILRVYAERDKTSVRWCGSNEDALCQEIDESTDLVVFSLIMFNDSKILSRAKQVIERAHAVGAKALVDVYHAVGVIPVDMVALGADFMIGGSYKYIRGGPGACWLAYQDDSLRTLDTGWFAKKDPFAFTREESIQWGQPFMESTPAILPIYQARAGIEMIESLGVDRLRVYSLMQQSFLRNELAKVGVNCFQPENPLEYGAFSLIYSENAAEDASRLISAGVNVDARADAIRFCPDILNSQEELSRAAKVVSQILN